MKHQTSSNDRFYIPDTISPQWQQALRMMANFPQFPPQPAPDDIAGWSEMKIQMEEFFKQIYGYEAVLKHFTPKVIRRTLGGVPILEVEPRHLKVSNHLLIYTHGGVYTLGSAESTLSSAVLMAAATGLRVMSIDYTTAPRGKWQQVTDEVVAVFKALIADGQALKHLAIYGDSAGGGLAMGSVQKMRDQGIGMPAAVVLWSPWADVTETGDTYFTLRKTDLMINYEKVCRPSAGAYATLEDQKHPYVSPVYGDYRQGFPPTLIQGGTKEIFLSGFIRLYRAMDSAGQTVVLDLYEGMPHAFQFIVHDSPESQLAIRKSAEFIQRYLGT